MAVLADAQKRRFLAPHYVANAALLATYALVRLNFRPSDPAAPGRQGRINTLEQLHVWVRPFWQGGDGGIEQRLLDAAAVANGRW